MSNEIVKYSNELNAVPFRKFNSREFNIFFSIVSRMRDKGTDTVVFPFDSIKTLSRYDQHTNHFVKDLENTYHKMLNLNIWYEDTHVYKAWVLFTGFEINKDKQTVAITINPKLKEVLNSIVNWTRFSLSQFVDLRSSYAKTAFRLFKQYRIVGYRKFNLKEFRVLFAIPKSYKARDINKRVLKPIQQELSQYLKGLHISKIKKGRKIIAYAFSWKPEMKNADDFSQGTFSDIRKRLDNVVNTNELDQEEKKLLEEKILNDADNLEASKKKKLIKLYLGPDYLQKEKIKSDIATYQKNANHKKTTSDKKESGQKHDISGILDDINNLSK
ncbi:hypothetical protein WR164_13940 [Philodulcilactobacillus myokoensis]|uniref:Initiator Rep protein WH1 domain-containing protein n=1 Tax=Philodulcilactobacillus myokoensis TaxID=2929573 RepID=A0A9W6B3A3_9LACO|nr:replication initiation protein [Philodulcilactobacillus myokoensis]GLB47415.1 hypothetical protein WR164_13940 [Philodulcilactobacillus myokoensis]